MQDHSYITFRQAGDPGNLAVGQQAPKLERQDLAGAPIQRLHCQQYLPLFLGENQAFLQQGIVGDWHATIQRFSRVSRFKFPVVNGEVMRNGKQPGLDLGLTGIKLVQMV